VAQSAAFGDEFRQGRPVLEGEMLRETWRVLKSTVLVDRRPWLYLCEQDVCCRAAYVSTAICGGRPGVRERSGL